MDSNPNNNNNNNNNSSSSTSSSNSSSSISNSNTSSSWSQSRIRLSEFSTAPFQCMVKTWARSSGPEEPRPFVVDPRETNAAVKARLVEQLDPVLRATLDKVELIYAGIHMDDERIVSDYNVHSESTLHLVLTWRLKFGNFWRTNSRCHLHGGVRDGDALLHSTSLPDLAEGGAVPSLRPSIALRFRHLEGRAGLPPPGHTAARLLAEPSRLAVLELRPELAALPAEALLARLEGTRDINSSSSSSSSDNSNTQDEWLAALAAPGALPLALAAGEDPEQLTATLTQDLLPGRLYALALLHLPPDSAGHFVQDSLLLPFRTPQQ